MSSNTETVDKTIGPVANTEKVLQHPTKDTLVSVIETNGNPKMSYQLPYELLCCSFLFLDRKQLLTLLERVSQRVNSLIKREFESKDPLFFLDTIRYDDSWNERLMYRAKPFGTYETSADQETLLNIIAQCKFLRAKKTIITSTNPLTQDFLRSISHIWNGQKFYLYCKHFQLLDELFRSISTCKETLSLDFPDSLAVLNQLPLRNINYLEIKAMGNSYSQDAPFPYISNIADFLFASDGITRKMLIVSSSNTVLSHLHCKEIVRAVQKRFRCTTEPVKFCFGWGSFRFARNHILEIIGRSTEPRLACQINNGVIFLKTYVTGEDEMCDNEFY